MGRAKIAMEYIKKAGARKTTFERRKKGLKKKAQELATLCDVPLCVVIYEGPTSEPDTFPENRDQVREVIGRYVSIPSEEKSKKRTLNLQSMFESKKKRKIDDYPSWLPQLDGLGKEELLELVSVLDHKLEAVEERMKGFNYTGIGNAIDAVGLGFEYGMQFPMLDQMGVDGYGSWSSTGGVSGGGLEADYVCPNYGGDGSWSSTGVSGAGLEADYVCPNYEDDANGMMMMMMMGNGKYYDGPHGEFGGGYEKGRYRFELPHQMGELNWYEQSCLRFEV